MSTTFFPFESQQRTGASVVFAFALLSTISLSLFIFRTIWDWVDTTAGRASEGRLARDKLFFKSPLGGYTGCLLLADLFTSAGGVVEIGWIAVDGVTHGPACNIQGALSEIGELATAYFIVMLGVYACIALALRSHSPLWLVIASVVIGWIGSILIAAGSASVSSTSLGPLYGFTALDCSISRAYPVARAFLYFVPVFLSSFASIIVYSSLFLILRGRITVNDESKFYMLAKGPSRNSTDSSTEHYYRRLQAVAYNLMWFPAAFMICIIPNTAVQLISTSEHPIHGSAAAFTLVLRHMAGFLHVLILLNVSQTLNCWNSASPGRSHKVSGDAEISLTYGDTGKYRLFYPQRNDASTTPVIGHGSEFTSPLKRYSTGNRHTRAITKSMISKPQPIDLYLHLAEAVNEVPSCDLVKPEKNIPSMLDMHKPLPALPLLPEHERAVDSLHHFTTISAASGANQSTAPRSPPSPPVGLHTKSANLATVGNDSRARTLLSPTQSVSSTYPSISQTSEHDREIAVFNLYMPPRQSSQHGTPPDFPVTASECSREPWVPQLARESHEFARPVPPPRTVHRSPPSTSTLRLAVPPGGTCGSSSSMQKLPPSTATVTEFDINEYMTSSPPPSSPSISSTLLPLDSRVSGRQRASDAEQMAVIDMAYYYCDEAPALLPLPHLRSRLTIFDDEVSAHPSSDGSWGFGDRPRELYLDAPTLPLPSHMRLDISVSPTSLGIPMPTIMLAVRGSRLSS